MSLQIRFFSIPLINASDFEDDLNLFLRSVQTVNLHRELVCQESRYYWAIAVEYMSGNTPEARERKREPGKKKIDYKEVLSPEDFEIFARLRDWRKETAAKEGVQLYNVFMNDQLAAMVQNRVVSKNGLKSIEGVGEGRIAKYGDAVLSILNEVFSTLAD